MHKIWMKTGVVVLTIILCVGCSSISKNAKDKYQQATYEWEQGNYSQPIGLLEAAVVDSPDFLDAHLKLAEYKIHQNRAAGAIENIEKAKILDETIASPFILKGNALIQLNENLKAQGEFNKALKLEPSQEQKFDVYAGKAIAKTNLGLYEDAQDYIDKAKKISPGDKKITYFNALLREKKIGVNSLTLKEYKEVLYSSPDNLQVLKSMGDSWKQLEQSRKAIKYYQRFLEAGGRSQEVNKYLDQQIQIRKTAQRKKSNNKAELARLELERVKAELEKTKIKEDTQKAIAASEAQKAIANAETKKAIGVADAEAKKAIADAEAKKADAEAKKAIAEAEAAKAKYLQEPLLKDSIVEDPIILNCALCGRIYKGEKQKTCDYDGTPLIDLSDE